MTLARTHRRATIQREEELRAALKEIYRWPEEGSAPEFARTELQTSD